MCKKRHIAIPIYSSLIEILAPSPRCTHHNTFLFCSRGFVLGLWSACASVGNIIGALMVSQVLHYGYDVSQYTISKSKSFQDFEADFP